jgi:cell division protein FtsL
VALLFVTIFAAVVLLVSIPIMHEANTIKTQQKQIDSQDSLITEQQGLLGYYQAVAENCSPQNGKLPLRP